MTYRTLADWGGLIDAMPQARPVAVVFFAQSALQKFLKEAMADKDVVPSDFIEEDDAETEAEPNEAAQ